MSALTKVFQEEIKKIEEKAKKEGQNQPYRPTHHLTPPVGWLNDPNGLCWFRGQYHVFFQYSPFEVKGGLKFWGHYTSPDLIEWTYEGAALYPDSQEDCHGVYSGSALTEDGELELFYTGNVKLDGEGYDYINTGRKTSILWVKSRDGIHFGHKRTVLDNGDYPKAYSLHIRDPKVWKENGIYWMALGGRTKEDFGSVLLYRSKDKENWELEKSLSTEKPFGYMWECPDLFRLGGRQVLSVSPQGLQRGEFENQNVYQSGYFFLSEKEEETKVRPEEFREWDMGFDFYAPQTFEDQKGRRILIGWMGMPDAEEEYTNPTISEGWQHCLTLPRELTLRSGKIYQNPVEEMKKLRGQEISFSEKDPVLKVRLPFELEIQKPEGEPFRMDLGKELFLEYKEHTATLALSREAGAGRGSRKARLEGVREIRIFADTSAVEIYLNQGETVFSTRYYPEDASMEMVLTGKGFYGRLWKLDSMKFKTRR